MTEINTVMGNVSRTHHPCGPCHALVDRCPHWQPRDAKRQTNAARSAAWRDRRRARANAVAAVAEFRRRQGMGALPQ